MEGLVVLGIIVAFVVLGSIKEVSEFERALKFTFGKYTKTLNPGWHVILPVFQKIIKVDIRVKAVDVPNQEAITEDNISISINAVIYYNVNVPEKAILKVENFYYAISQLAQTTMRNAVGEVELDELLRNRDKIAVSIKEIVDKATDPWGISVQAVELKDVVLPQDLKRTMAKVAEADREKKAVIIKAEGEVIASTDLAKAAKTLASAPGSLHLRTLQSINDLSSDQSNTTIWMIPIETLRAMESFTQMVQKTQKDNK